MGVRMYTCGVPTAHCQGTWVNASAMMRSSEQSMKAHGSRDAAFRCMSRYLVRVLGAERIGSREFRLPGEPIRVLTKKSRYGGELRQGKYQTRVMPGQKHTGGIIGSH